MITLLILIGLGLLGCLFKNGFFRLMIMATVGVLALLHLSLWIQVSISFDVFKAKHEQLKIDLSISRESIDPYERVAILQEITKHNQSIAVNKQLNKNWFVDQYIDDRVDSLVAIK